MKFKIIFVSIYLILLFTGVTIFYLTHEDRYCLAYQDTYINISNKIEIIDPLSYEDNWVVVCYDNKLDYNLELMKRKNINLDINITN